MTEIVFNDGKKQSGGMATTTAVMVPADSGGDDTPNQLAANTAANASTANGEHKDGDKPQLSPIEILAKADNMLYDGRLWKEGKKAEISSTALQSLGNYHINHEKYFGWFRGYVRQDWDTISVPDDMSELKADWSELFFDLIYVACIVHISAEASYSVKTDSRRRMMADLPFDCPDLADYHRRLGSDDYSSSSNGYCYYNQGDYDYIVTAFSQFGLMVKAWESMVSYTSYFVMNQRMDEFFRVIFMICVVCMGIFVHDDPDYCYSFLIAYAFLHAASILRYIKVWMIPRARKKGLYEIIKSMIIIVAIIIVTQVGQAVNTEDKEWCAMEYFGIFFGILVFEEISRLLMLTVINGPMSMNLPLNVPHFSERNGLFVTLILGEAIIASMLAELDGDNGFSMQETIEFSGAPPDIIVLFLLLASFVMTYFISRLYYDCQPPEEEIIKGEGNHAMRRSVKSALLYVYSHMILFFGLLGLGMGIKITASNLQSDDPRALDVMLPGWSIAAIVIALFMIRWAHPFSSENKQRIRVIWVVRIVSLLVMLVCPIFHDIANQGALFLVYVFCTWLLLFLDFEGQERIAEEKQHLKDQRRISLSSSPSARNSKHGHGHNVVHGMAGWKSEISKV